MMSRYRRASSRRRCSNCQRVSRPCRVQRMRPASSITRRCLVIAWRVIFVPAVKCVMDIGPSSESRATSRKRISSPSAAKIIAESFGCAELLWLSFLCKVRLDQFHDHAPTLFVGSKRLDTTFQRNPIESTFRHLQHDALRDLLKRKLDQRGRFLGVVDVWVDRIRMPTKGEQSLRLHALDGDLEWQSLILLLSFGDLVIHFCADDRSFHECTRCK